MNVAFLAFLYLFSMIHSNESKLLPLKKYKHDFNGLIKGLTMCALSVSWKIINDLIFLPSSILLLFISKWYPIFRKKHVILFIFYFYIFAGSLYSFIIFSVGFNWIMKYIWCIYTYIRVFRDNFPFCLRLKKK